jgi:hypothetical protein
MTILVMCASRLDPLGHVCESGRSGIETIIDSVLLSWLEQCLLPCRNLYGIHKV